jgi:lambda repressor-like predicted transcriptional regulator
MNELAWVQQAVSRIETARACLLSEIAAAREAGYSLRAIAEAAGLSHEQVRQLLRRSRVS